MFTRYTQSQGHQVVDPKKIASEKEEKIRLAMLREQAQVERPQQSK